MDETLLYCVLPITNTIFSLISKETLKTVDPVSYTACIIYISYNVTYIQ